jgi:hypothetical protein
MTFDQKVVFSGRVERRAVKKWRRYFLTGACQDQVCGYLDTVVEFGHFPRKFSEKVAKSGRSWN